MDRNPSPVALPVVPRPTSPVPPSVSSPVAPRAPSPVAAHVLALAAPRVAWLAPLVALVLVVTLAACGAPTPPPTGGTGPGSPTAAFVITPLADPDIEGTAYYEFDASASSDDGSIVEYVWRFDGFEASVGDDPTTRRGFGRNGSYLVRLTVVDDEGKEDTSEQTLVISNLPHDYWGVPPVHASTLDDGSALPGEVERTPFAITPDGRYVAFSVGSDFDSPDGDLLPDDTNGLRDVYRKDLDTGELLLVSEADAGVYTGWEHVAISADGRYVAYTSRLAQDGSRWRVHVRDMQLGGVETIERADTDLHIGPASLSADGRTVLYAVDHSPSDPTAEGAYVKELDGGAPVKLDAPPGNTWVLALTPSAAHALVRVYDGLYVVNVGTNTATRADTNAADEPADAGSFAIGRAISDDGRYVVFTSESSNLVPQLTTAFRDHVFRKDMATSEVVLVTKSPKTGAEADTSSDLATISGDGRYVYFSTFATNLVPVGQKPGPDFDNCSLGMCPSGLVHVFDAVANRMALVEVGFDSTTPCCGSQSNRLVAVGNDHVAFTSYNAQLVQNGDDDTRRVFRAVNPLAAP